jgi:hypothetical protein
MFDSEEYKQKLLRLGVKLPTKEEIRREVERMERRSKAASIENTPKKNDEAQENTNAAVISSNEKSENREDLERTKNLRVRTSFSFDPMAVKPILNNLNIYLDFTWDDPDYIEGVSSLCTKMGATLHRRVYSPKDREKDQQTHLVVWFEGDYKTLERCEEYRIPVVTNNWVFDCAKHGKVLPFSDYKITDRMKQLAKTRQEFGVKAKKPKGKLRMSAAPASSTYPRKSKPAVDSNDSKIDECRNQIENAIKTKDMSKVLDGMAQHIKELCRGDDEVRKLLFEGTKEDSSSAPSRLTEFSKILKDTEAEKQSNQNSVMKKRVKMNPDTKVVKMDKEEPAQKSKTVLPLSSFLRNHNGRKPFLVVYQGDYARLLAVKSMKTVTGDNVNLISAESFAYYADQITCLYTDEETTPTLALLHCLLRQVPIIDPTFVQECIKAGVFCSPGQGLASQPDWLKGKVNRDVLAKTSLVLFEGNHTRDHQNRSVIISTVTDGIVFLGGKIAEQAVYSDAVLVLPWDEEEIKRPQTYRMFSDRYIYVVRVQWLLDSMLSPEKKSILDEKYRITTTSQDSHTDQST